MAIPYHHRLVDSTTSNQVRYEVWCCAVSPEAHTNVRCVHGMTSLQGLICMGFWENCKPTTRVSFMETIVTYETRLPGLLPS